MTSIPINFIITCFNREAYWPDLKSIINGYNGIKPNICLVYNGDKEDFEYTVKIANRGHQLGEFDLIKAGYEYHKQHNPDVKFFIKISIDSWLLNEEVILKIYDLVVNKYKVCYAGNFWNTPQQLSTDIFFANIESGNVFETFRVEDSNNETTAIQEGKIIVENLMFRAVSVLGGNFYLIREREPVHPNNRDKCGRLCWVMSHDLEENKKYLNYFRSEFPMSQIKHSYRVLCAKESDINEHLPRINGVASSCKTICEIGSRGIATWALLATKPDHVAIFPENAEATNIKSLAVASKMAGIKFSILDSQSIIGLKYEMLFIDVVHGESELLHILDSMKDYISKYIIIHNDTLKKLDGWVLETQLSNNNGLTIFKKK